VTLHPDAVSKASLSSSVIFMTAASPGSPENQAQVSAASRTSKSAALSKLGGMVITSNEGIVFGFLADAAARRIKAIASAKRSFVMVELVQRVECCMLPVRLKSYAV
jgi:hypothetical protein